MFTLVLSITPKPGNWPSIHHISPHFVINLIWAAVAFYLFYFFFIRYFEQRRFIQYLLYSIVSSICLTFIFIPFHTFFFQHFNILDWRIFLPPMFGTFILTQCGCLVRGFEDWFANIKLKAELENRNLRNELELLKSQINPHFLFNTLNNIDFLIQKSPMDASASLIKLSEMLRYMTYDASNDKVLITNEILYIQNYIDLQKLRYRNNNFVNFYVSNVSKNMHIAPLLLVTFIENAFKFASDSTIYPVIDIRLQCTETSIIFECNNFYNKEAKKKTNATGMGLENVKRRLELIYPHNYQLTILPDSNMFKVYLKINLK